MMEKACREQDCTLASALCIPTCGWFQQSEWKYAEILTLLKIPSFWVQWMSAGASCIHTGGGRAGTDHIRTLQT
jgi:hypothetical protein